MPKLRIGSIEDDKPRKAPGNGLSRFDGLSGNLETGRPTIDCRHNDACRADAGTIHGDGSRVQEAASWSSTKRGSQAPPQNPTETA
jgi:hypothetical protein